MASLAPAAGDAAAARYCDIGANLADSMFSGVYNGKQKHDGDMTNVLSRAGAAGVRKIIVTGTSLDASRTALRLARDKARERAGADGAAGGGAGGSAAPGDGAGESTDGAGGGSAPELFASVGVHPTNAGDFDEFEGGAEALVKELRATLEDGCTDARVVCVGECGLDYARLKFCDAETQRRHLEPQLLLAAELRLPLFLHCREAAADLAAALRKHKDRLVAGGVVHSFDGTAEEAAEFLSLGFHIGLNGCSLREAASLEVVADAIPLDRLLLETDAPWCGIRPSHAGSKFVKTKWPEKKKEKWVPEACVKGRSEPCHIVQVCEVVAGVKGVTPEVVAQTAWENSERLFFTRVRS